MTFPTYQCLIDLVKDILLINFLWGTGGSPQSNGIEHSAIWSDPSWTTSEADRPEKIVTLDACTAGSHWNIVIMISLTYILLKVGLPEVSQNITSQAGQSRHCILYPGLFLQEWLMSSIGLTYGSANYRHNSLEHLLHGFRGHCTCLKVSVSWYTKRKREPEGK